MEREAQQKVVPPKTNNAKIEALPVQKKNNASEPLHHWFLISVAIQIYNEAKSKGASTKGALLILAQASIESGYGEDALKRGDYNLFGVMTAGTDYKKTTSAGKIRDYSKKGGWEASITDYFEGKERKWPDVTELIKKEDFTADDIDQAFYTGAHFEKKEQRNKTGHNAYNANDISKDESVNNNKYGQHLLKQINDFKKRFLASLEYQIKKNDEEIKDSKILVNSIVVTNDAKEKLKAKMVSLQKQSTILEEVKNQIKT